MALDYKEKPNVDEFHPNEFFEVSNTPFDISEHLIYAVISGSRAYGMETPTSDTDIRGVVVPPKKFFLGLSKCEQVENQSKDVCYYTLNKFVQLAFKNNVHALEMLFMPQQNITFVNELGKELLSQRDLFPSKVLGYSFGGYAYQQLLTMRTKISNHSGRQNLIQKFGYDTKFAAHAVRLYRSGAEFLRTGHLVVRRPDFQELLDIRNGKYTFDEFAVFSEEKKPELIGGLIKDESDKFETAFKASTLPDKPDFNKVEEMLINLQERALKYA